MAKKSVSLPTPPANVAELKAQAAALQAQIAATEAAEAYQAFPRMVQHKDDVGKAEENRKHSLAHPVIVNSQEELEALGKDYV